MFYSIVLTEANLFSETMTKTTTHNDRTHCSYLCDFTSTLCEKVPSDIVLKARISNNDINRFIVYARTRVTAKGILDQTRPMIRQTKLAVNPYVSYATDLLNVINVIRNFDLCLERCLRFGRPPEVLGRYLALQSHCQLKCSFLS